MDQMSPAVAANIRYQEAHLSDSRVPDVIAAIAICLPCAIGAVALRFVSRRLGQIPIKADDWWIVLGLVSQPTVVSDIKGGRHFLMSPASCSSLRQALLCARCTLPT